MRLLSDENLPHELRHELPGHDVFTVAFVGGGIDNGELLRRAASAGFDALVTKDANLQYEQNLVNLPLAVVILHAPTNDFDDIRPLIPARLSALRHCRQIKSRTFGSVVAKIGTPMRHFFKCLLDQLFQHADGTRPCARGARR